MIKEANIKLTKKEDLTYEEAKVVMNLKFVLRAKDATVVTQMVG